jgi:hypothetical protein
VVQEIHFFKVRLRKKSNIVDSLNRPRVKMTGASPPSRWRGRSNITHLEAACKFDDENLGSVKEVILMIK